MSAKPLASSALGLSRNGPGGIAYGVLDGFLAQMQLVGAKNQQRIDVLFRHAGEGREEALERALAEAPEVKASGVKAKHLKVDAKTLTLLIPQGFVSLPGEEEIVARVRAVLDVLKSVSSPEPQACRSCGTASAEPLVVNGVVDRLCAGCIERVDDETRRAAAEYESRTANLPLGLAFALVAGAAGAVVYGGVMIATDRMFWMLAILAGMMVGYAAVKGAGKGGPVVQGMAALVTVVSVLAGLLGFIGYTAQQDAATRGHTIDWAVFVASSPQILIAGGSDTLFSLAGGLFGSVYAMQRARKKEFAMLRPPESSSGGGNLVSG